MEKRRFARFVDVCRFSLSREQIPILRMRLSADLVIVKLAKHLHALCMLCGPCDLYSGSNISLSRIKKNPIT